MIVQKKARVFLILLVPAAFIFQTLHEVEHFSQIYQRWWLGVGPQMAHGILFFLDIEWNHFLFNTGYLLLLVLIAFFLVFDRGAHAEVKKAAFGKLGLNLFWAGVIIQAYHVIEHTVRMGQFFQLGCTPCPGILGWYFDLAYLHFTFNTLTWLLPTPIFFLIFRMVKESLSPSQTVQNQW